MGYAGESGGGGGGRGGGGVRSVANTVDGAGNCVKYWRMYDDCRN